MIIFIVIEDLPCYINCMKNDSTHHTANTDGRFVI